MGIEDVSVWASFRLRRDALAQDTAAALAELRQQLASGIEPIRIPIELVQASGIGFGAVSGPSGAGTEIEGAEAFGASAEALLGSAEALTGSATSLSSSATSLTEAAAAMLEAAETLAESGGVSGGGGGGDAGEGSAFSGGGGSSSRGGSFRGFSRIASAFYGVMEAARTFKAYEHEQDEIARAGGDQTKVFSAEKGFYEEAGGTILGGAAREVIGVLPESILGKNIAPNLANAEGDVEQSGLTDKTTDEKFRVAEEREQRDRNLSVLNAGDISSGGSEIGKRRAEIEARADEEAAKNRDDARKDDQAQKEYKAALAENERRFAEIPGGPNGSGLGWGFQSREDIDRRHAKADAQARAKFDADTANLAENEQIDPVTGLTPDQAKAKQLATDQLNRDIQTQNRLATEKSDVAETKLKFGAEAADLQSFDYDRSEQSKQKYEESPEVGKHFDEETGRLRAVLVAQQQREASRVSGDLQSSLLESQDRLSGDTDAEKREQFKRERADQRFDVVGKFGEKSDQASDFDKDTAQKQIELDDELNKKRVLSRQEAEDRIQAIAQESLDRQLQLSGTSYESDILIFDRAIDLKIKRLQELADAETDAAKKQQLLDEAEAERAQAPALKAAYEAQKVQERRDSVASGQAQTDAENLRAGGQNSAAAELEERQKRQQEKDDADAKALQAHTAADNAAKAVDAAQATLKLNPTNPTLQGVLKEAQEERDAANSDAQDKDVTASQKAQQLSAYNAGVIRQLNQAAQQKELEAARANDVATRRSAVGDEESLRESFLKEEQDLPKSTEKGISDDEKTARKANEDAQRDSEEARLREFIQSEKPHDKFSRGQDSLFEHIQDGVSNDDGTAEAVRKASQDLATLTSGGSLSSDLKASSIAQQAATQALNEAAKSLAQLAASGAILIHG